MNIIKKKREEETIFLVSSTVSAALGSFKMKTCVNSPFSPFSSFFPSFLPLSFV